MKLNKKNYFTVENKYISNSKIGDWFKDINYFYKKHVLGTITQKQTDAMLIGSAVDVWLTEGANIFHSKYKAVTRRNLKNPPEGVTELTMSVYKNVEALCKRVQKLSIYKELQKFKTQEILQMDMDLGLFKGICGIPDWFLIDGDTAIIVDLKTAKDINKRKYFWHCIDYGYFRQQAMYQMLIQHNYPEVKECISYHLVVGKDYQTLPVALYQLDQKMVDEETTNIKLNLIDIKTEKEFKQKDISFSEYETLESPNI